MKTMDRTVGLLLHALLVTALPAAGHSAVVVERWGVAGRVQHAKTLVYEVRGTAGTLMRLDLSALPAEAKIYRARLFFRRGGLYGSGFDITAVQLTGQGEAAELKPVGRPLALAPPHWRWFDATDAVRRWAAGGKRQGLLLLRKAPRFDREATFLEIAYEGELRDPPQQVAGVKAFYRSGQVFITFKETETFAGGKEDITWGELGKRFSNINYEGPIPRDDQGELRYRVYRHKEPLTAASLAAAELIGEAVPGSIYNTRLVPGGDFIKRRPKAVAGRLAVEPGRPLPAGAGLFVHTCRHHGRWHYAVVTSLDGVENTTALSGANVAGPVEQRPQPPAPVLQRDEATELRGGKAYHEQWYSYWAVPPQAPRPTRYDFAVGFCPTAMTHPAPLTFTRGHTWGHEPEMPGPAPRREIVMSMGADPPNGFWTGINDARETLKGIEQGTWRPFAHNRQEALIDWAGKQWEVDEKRIVGSIGAWGLWEIKRADLYAHIHGWGMPEVTKGFQCFNWARGAWGPPQAYKGRPDDQNPWVLQDYTRWVQAHPEKELPYFMIHTGWGAHFTEMGWPPFPRFVRTLIDTKRAFCMQSPAVGQAMSAGVITLRRDQSVPAFGNCSLDDNIGEGELGSGRAFGQINGYLVWESDTIVDEPGLYGITIWLWDGDRHGRGRAPLDTCTVDLTPRRCRKFTPKPGQSFSWMNLTAADGKEVRSGQVQADKHGLVTLEKLKVTKGRHRILIRR